MFRNVSENRNEFIRGYNPAVSQPGVIWVARHDWNDADVRAAGTLAGLSSNGDHDLSSAWYLTGQSYQVGTELTPDGTTGQFRPAQDGDLVFAKVKRDFAPPVNFGPVYTPASHTGQVSAGVRGGSFRVGRHSEAKPAGLFLVRMELVPTYIKGGSGS